MGDLMSNIKYLYVRNPEKKRDITIVSDLYTENDKFFVNCAWSFRSNHDNFVKKEGRNVAKERLDELEPGYSATIEIENPKFYTIAADVLRAVLNSENTPRKYLNDIADDLYFFEYMSKKPQSKERWKMAFGELVE